MELCSSLCFFTTVVRVQSITGKIFHSSECVRARHLRQRRYVLRGRHSYKTSDRYRDEEQCRVYFQITVIGEHGIEKNEGSSETN